MVFTNDWFEQSAKTARRILSAELPDDAQILEIGSFEGQSTCWFLEAFPKAHVTCVDPFLGSIEHNEEQKNNLYGRFAENIGDRFNRLTIHKNYSSKVLPVLLANHKSYDCIYIDGSHEACDVLLDGVLALELIKPGGFVVFDDYRWKNDAVEVPPKPAIDAIIKCNPRMITLCKGKQAILQMPA